MHGIYALQNIEISYHKIKKVFFEIIAKPSLRLQLLHQFIGNITKIQTLIIFQLFPF